MKRKFTRRELALAAAAGAITARAQQSVAEDPVAAARDLNARNIDTLAKFEIPISTEPAFQFKA